MNSNEIIVIIQPYILENVVNKLYYIVLKKRPIYLRISFLRQLPKLVLFDRWIIRTN